MASNFETTHLRFNRRAAAYKSLKLELDNLTSSMSISNSSGPYLPKITHEGYY
jgi:hypothetical protein